MNKLKLLFSNLSRKQNFKRDLTLTITAILLLLPFFFAFNYVSAQKADNSQPRQKTPFKIGEKLTYNISFEKFNNAAYAELYVVSRGKLSNRDAVELHARIKTNELVSAAFYLLDESRQTFASAENGHPLYVRKTQNASVLPEDTITNYLNAPTENYDLLSLIYSLRYFGAEGVYPLSENGKNYTINFQAAGSEDIKTDAGEYETTITSVSSDYLSEKNITNLRINFSKDDQKIPALIRFKTQKGEFKASLASIQTIEGGFSNEPTPTPVPIPQAVKTPRPIPTATPYIDNQPLTNDFPFKLGESLAYQISANAQILGNITIEAAERKQLAGKDSLLLSGVFNNVAQNNSLFKNGDAIRVSVSPDFITPLQSDVRFTGTLSFLNQNVQFDQKNGNATINNSSKIEVPVGTHSILSLIYAIRAFNLKPSKDPTNPVNDTRVAVFWENQPYVFTLRPSSGELINLKGEKISAQLININTGNPQLDALNPRLWLSTDEKRLPLRLMLGNYQVDLISESNLLAK